MRDLTTPKAAILFDRGRVSLTLLNRESADKQTDTLPGIGVMQRCGQVYHCSIAAFLTARTMRPTVVK